MGKIIRIMKIHAHILAYNEEKILPFTLDYYSKFCEKIFVYDNMSTDSSDEIYKKYANVNVIKWNSNDEINELNYIQIKSNGYKESRKDNVDWVIVCDCDEILYHPRLLNKLEYYKNNGITVPLVNGHDMVSEEFPESDNTINSNSPELKLLHYKFLGKDYVEKIYRTRAERLSEFNKQNKFGEHYFNVPYDYMNKLLSENIQVI